MLEILGSLFGGGITGILGAVFTKVVEYKNQKRADAHEIKMAEVERETMKLEQAGKIKIAVKESEAEMDVAKTEAEAEKYLADVDAFWKSVEADKASFLTGKVRGTAFTSFVFTIVDALRGVVRPLLTFYMAILLTWIASTLYSIVKLSGGVDPDQAFVLLKLMISGLLYIGTVVILWWFGTRPTKSPSSDSTDLGGNIGRSLSRMRIKF